MQLLLVPIDRLGHVDGDSAVVDGLARDVCTAMVSLYEAVGFVPPWIGYLAKSGGTFVGTCGFKSPPAAGEVEIAYFTFPRFEGDGVATAMARALLTMGKAADPGLVVTAQTLRQRNASSRVLEKLGFRLRAELVHPIDGEIWEWEWRGV